MKITKFLIVTLFSLGIVLSLTPAKQAGALSGFSYVRSDHFQHYACKQYIAQSYYGPLYRVKTVSFGYDGAPAGIGVYAKITRNGVKVNEASNTSRWYGMIGTDNMYASAMYSDKLWIQGSYYGPSPSNGTVYVSNLTNCR